MENILSRNNEMFLNRGMKLGEERTSEAIVKKLSSMQMSESFIAEATELTVEKVREILGKQND